jgi:glycosyltransferase involved in cell wall biosynthesis
MDALALTSREDPFPLVMLEAAAHGVPTVCFADSGGGVEFVGSDAGLVAPYLDVAGFAEGILKLHERPVLREALGEAAARRVRARFSTSSQAPKLLASISRCLEREHAGVGRVADRRQAARETTT